MCAYDRGPDETELAAVSDDALRDLFTAVVREYAARSEASPELAAAEPGRVTATDVTRCCLALLRAADMQVFELGFWSTHFGIDGGDRRVHP